MKVIRIIKNLIMAMVMTHLSAFAIDGNSTGGITTMSLADPIEVINGKPMTFSTNTDDTWYYFSLSQNGNVLFSGKDSGGSGIAYVYIYDENGAQITNMYLSEQTVALNKGAYTMHITDASGGEIMLYSKQMADNPVPPTLPSSYADGYRDGQKACKDDPASCGIKPVVVVVPL